MQILDEINDWQLFTQALWTALSLSMMDNDKLLNFDRLQDLSNFFLSLEFYSFTYYIYWSTSS